MGNLSNLFEHQLTWNQGWVRWCLKPLLGLVWGFRGVPVCTSGAEVLCLWSLLLPVCLVPSDGTSLLATWPFAFPTSCLFFSSVFREKVKIEELAFGGHCGWPVRGMMRWRTAGEGHTSDSRVARSSHVTSPWPCPWPRDLRRTCCGLAASWLGPVTCRRPPESSGRCWLWADGMGCRDPSPGRWWRTPPGLWFSPPSGNQPREPSFLQVPSSWPCKLRAPHPEPHGARPGTPSADRVSSCCLARRLTAWLVSGQQRSA